MTSGIHSQASKQIWVCLWASWVHKNKQRRSLLERHKIGRHRINKWTEDTVLEPGRSSVESSSGYNCPHSLLGFAWEFEVWQFFLKFWSLAVASTVAVESACHMWSNKLSIGKFQGSKDILLLTKKVLLMVTTREKGRVKFISYRKDIKGF